jgi:N-acetylmuramoyl-L-alanine amidase
MALLSVVALGVTRLNEIGRASVATAANLIQPDKAPVAAAAQIALPGLAAGACMSQPPTAPGAGQTVFIDPGHGGIDPGVVGGGTNPLLEKDATLAVALQLSGMLRADGYRVVMARTADSTVVKLSASDSALGSLTASAEHRDLLARAACANAAGAAVLVSIHFNAFGDPSVGGTETYYDAARPYSAANRVLAADLQSAVVAALGTSDRGIWTDGQLAAPTLTMSGSEYGHLIELGPASSGWVDNPSQMPGALIEPLFISNPKEAKLAGGVAGQRLIAAALETGILKYLATTS